MPILILALLLIALAPVTTASADIAVEGYKKIPVTVTLDGVDTIASTHTVLLVTLNAMDRERVRIRATGLQGELNAPGGYQDQPMLVALTAEQVAALVTLLRGTSGIIPAESATSDEAVSAWLRTADVTVASSMPLHDFFAADGVAKSEVFPIQRSVPDYDEAVRIDEHYRVKAVTAGRVELDHVGTSRLAKDGTPAPTPSWLWVVLSSIGGFFLALLGVLGLRRRARNRSTPIPSDAL
ncbi:MAG: hypothetical protein AB7K09_20850 [Planctomycetota bacterium]